MKSRRTTNGLTLAVRTALPALILSGCVTTTQFERPAAPTVTQYDVSAPAAQFGGGEAGPAQHLTAGDAGGIVNWWQRFNSPAINAIVQQALDANRTLAESAARVEQAQELVNAKAGTRLPQVDLTASAARQQFGEQQFGNLLGPGFEIPPFTAYGVGPNVRYTLDYTGGTARGIEQQQALAEYQQYQLAAARLAISGHAV
ncbi:MAG: TolC family protein, partial [Nevskiaceae bacterium]|nr:TolC family protein [Nevskiaceae bacterium]